MDSRTTIEESVIVRRLPEGGGDYGWSMSVVRARGPHRGKEHCMALLCGGVHGKALALACARQIGENFGIDNFLIDETILED